METNALYSSPSWTNTVDLFIKAVRLSVVVFNRLVYEKVKASENKLTYIQLAIGTKDEKGEIKEVRSVPKLYNGLDYPNGFFTFMTAVISVDKGIVKSIDWDNGCHTCLQCDENSVLEIDGSMQLIKSNSPYYKAYQGKNCLTYDSKCADGANCDLTIYLTWSGSDVNGKVFQSANLRLSRFQSGSLESIVGELH